MSAIKEAGLVAFFAGINISINSWPSTDTLFTPLELGIMFNLMNVLWGSELSKLEGIAGILWIFH